MPLLLVCHVSVLISGNLNSSTVTPQLTFNRGFPQNRNLRVFPRHLGSVASLFCGAGRSSEVERSLMVRWVVGSILHGGGPIELFLVRASAPRLV